MKFGFSAEPAAWLGLAATIVVSVLTQVAGSGLIDAKGLDVLNTLIAIIPLIAGLVIRQFVTPVAAPVAAPTPTPPSVP